MIVQTDFDTALEARVDAVNRCHAYANEILPKLRDFFSQYVGKRIAGKEGTILLDTIRNKMAAELDLPKRPYISTDVYVGLPSMLASSSSLICAVMANSTVTLHDYRNETRVKDYPYEVQLYIGNVKGGIFNNVYENLPLDANHGKADYSVEEIIGARKQILELQRLIAEAKLTLGPFGETDH